MSIEPIPGRNACLIVPPLVHAGEEFQVRLLVQRPMETVFRRDVKGDLIEANLLESLSLDFEGQPVFTALSMNALTANPYLAFVGAIKQSGSFNARWRDQRSNEGSISASVRAAATKPGLRSAGSAAGLFGRDRVGATCHAATGDRKARCAIGLNVHQHNHSGATERR